jgi:hypothetical protein
MSTEPLAAVEHRTEAERMIAQIAYPGDLGPADALAYAQVHATLAVHGSNIMIAGAIDALRETLAESIGGI